MREEPIRKYLIKSIFTSCPLLVIFIQHVNQQNLEFLRNFNYFFRKDNRVSQNHSLHHLLLHCLIQEKPDANFQWPIFHLLPNQGCAGWYTLKSSDGLGGGVQDKLAFAIVAATDGFENGRKANLLYRHVKLKAIADRLKLGG